MCGRFAFYSPREAVFAAFGLELELRYEPRYNIAPGQNVSIIRSAETGQPVTDTCRWGLVPFWAKDSAVGNHMINARAETLGEKPAYRQAFVRRRCLVLASGFYEWHTDESGKSPWFISRSAGDVFGMAGLWERWDKGEAEPLKSCTIITTAANDFLSRLHHRMPVIMGGEEMQSWLQSDASAEELNQMLLHPKQTELQAWKVSRKVNNPVNDFPELITAYDA